MLYNCLRRHYPDCNLLISKKLTEFFEQMQQEVLNIVAIQTTAISQVVVVDMFTGFNDGLLVDDVHYNEAGAEFIANRYYNALVTILE